MINEKEILVKRILKLRQEPMTEELLTLLSQYKAIIDPNNPDEISQLLFYEGECYFRLGNLDKSLQCLTRCLHAPKSFSLLYLDALSYNLLGMIYLYLGQESIAQYNLLESIRICEEAHLSHEFSISYANLGYLYSNLGNYEKAIDYNKKALSYLNPDAEESKGLMALCLAYQGIAYFKSGSFTDAVDTGKHLHSFLHNLPDGSYIVPVLVLDLLTAYHDGKHDAFSDTFHKLLEYASTDKDFLMFSLFYFDVFDFLLEEHLQPQMRQLLDHIQHYASDLPLQFLKYQIQDYETRYARDYLSEDDYLTAVSQLLDLHPAYDAEQRSALVYSLEYTEQIHQTKHLSEQLEKKSKLDPMTGLFNKYTIQFLAEEHLTGMNPSSTAALLLIDMDHFKQINDTLGHLTGDAIISDTALIIRRFFSNDAICGRIGGDEFLIFIPNVEERSSLVLQAELLRQEIWNQTAERNLTVTTQASIGIAFSNEELMDYEHLFKAADQALYRAKREGRNKVIVAD